MFGSWVPSFSFSEAPRGPELGEFRVEDEVRPEPLDRPPGDADVVAPERPDPDLVRHGQVVDPGRVDPHDPGRRGVHGQGVVSHDQDAGLSGRAHDGAVALHPDDAVDDGIMRLDGRVDLTDAERDAVPMEDVLGPPVGHARQDAEHVLQAQGDPGQLMGLHLGHGDDDFRRRDGLGQDDLPQRVGLGVGAFDRGDVVVIEVDETDPAPFGQGFVPGAAEEVLRVTVVRRSLGQDDLPGPEVADVEDERFDEPRIAVDRPVRGDIDHVRLDDDALAPDVGGAARRPAGPDGRSQRFRSIVGAGDEGHLEKRARGRPFGGLARGSGQSRGRPGRERGCPRDADELAAGHARAAHRPPPWNGIENGGIAQDEIGEGRFEHVAAEAPVVAWSRARRAATPATRAAPEGKLLRASKAQAREAVLMSPPSASARKRRPGAHGRAAFGDVRGAERRQRQGRRHRARLELEGLAVGVAVIPAARGHPAVKDEIDA